MKRAEATRLLWGGLLVYCIAQAATFVLFVTHLAKVNKQIAKETRENCFGTVSESELWSQMTIFQCLKALRE